MPRDDYPPEYDLPTGCDVCGKHVDTCDCPECPKCGVVGDVMCYEEHGLKPAHDSVASFCEHIGVCSSLGSTLRGIEKYNVTHVWVVLPDGTRMYYHSEGLDKVHPSTRLQAVGVGGIAWDGSDWEYSEEVEAGHGWTALAQARAGFDAALTEWEAHKEDEARQDAEKRIAKRIAKKLRNH